jgi:hypothetical protein
MATVQKRFELDDKSLSKLFNCADDATNYWLECRRNPRFNVRFRGFKSGLMWMTRVDATIWFYFSVALV